MEFIAKWFDELTSTEVYEILRSRAEIFIVEQNINCQDMDCVDYRARHCFIKDNGRVIAYLRAFYKDGEEGTVKVGRVLTLEHGKGHGIEIMKFGMEDIKRSFSCNKIALNAQKYAIGFYEKFGFKTVSEEFWEEGIIHVAMEMHV